MHIHYLLYCERKLWLYSHNINMEYTSEIVKDGKIIHETSYDRRSEKLKNIDIGSGKIDYIDNKNKIIHETKRSSNNIDSSIYQLKLYLYTLNDVSFTGLIEIPKEKKKYKIILNQEDKITLENHFIKINEVVCGQIPKKLNSKKCNLCSYYEYCYS